MTTHASNSQRADDTIARARQAEVAASLSFGLGDRPPVMERAEGAVIVDPDGREYLDMVAGFGSLNLGHTHPAIVEAAARQLAIGQQAMSMLSPLRIELVERLAGYVGPRYRTILGASGSEAVETALKMIRRATGHTGVVAFTGGFHGRTMGALALMGKHSQRDGLGALPGPVYHLPYPDPDRSPLAAGGDVVGATLGLLRSYLEDPAAGWGRVGAVVIEPVQGNGGMIPAPPGFMAGLADLAAEHGIMLIADEVMSGFHRTGRRFAYEHDGVTPDVVVAGKSISAGLPLSACIVRPELAEANPAGVESSTYAGNLVSCAAAVAAQDVYDEAGFSAIAARLGEFMLGRLREVLAGHPKVGVIRGRGLMLGIELVDSVESGRPLEIARAVSQACLDRGLLVYPGGHFANVIGLLPPLIVTEAQLSDAADRIADALAEVAG